MKNSEELSNIPVPKLVEIPQSKKEFPQKAAHYKQSEDELTDLEKVIVKMIGNSNYANNYYNEKVHEMVPVIRQVEDFLDVRSDDRITYIMEDNGIRVQAFNTERKLVRYHFSRNEISKFIRENQPFN